MPSDRNSKYYKDNPFGARTLMVRRLKGAIEQGDIESKEELDSAVKDIVDKIYEYVPKMYEMVEARQACSHDFEKSQWTFRETTFNYMYVYERKCKVCGYLEEYVQTFEEQDKPLPDWAEGATQRPYNNFI